MFMQKSTCNSCAAVLHYTYQIKNSRLQTGGARENGGYILWLT